MKQTQKYRKEREKTHEGCEQPANRCEVVRKAIARTKETVLQDYFELAQEHANVLRLALNEAEALAWQTAHPHLFFPALAAEKAQSAVNWHRRQRSVRRPATEVAFAE
jgi:hypothetical protein